MSTTTRISVLLLIITVCTLPFAGVVGATADVDTDSVTTPEDGTGDTQSIEVVQASGPVEYDVSEDRIYIEVRYDQYGGEIVCYTDTLQCNRLEWSVSDSGDETRHSFWYNAESHLGILFPRGGPRTDGKVGYAVWDIALIIDNDHYVRWMGFTHVGTIYNVYYNRDDTHLSGSAYVSTITGQEGISFKCDTAEPPCYP